MVCLALSRGVGPDDVDLRDARQRFESHVLRTSNPILERHRLIGRGTARMTRGVHPAYVAELRVIVQLSVWQRSGLVDPDQIGVPLPRAMIESLVARMRTSRREYAAPKGLAHAVGAMFLWWHERCARHAPEYLEADVLVEGAVGDVVLDELARLVWSLRHRGTQSDRR